MQRKLPNPLRSVTSAAGSSEPAFTGEFALRLPDLMVGNEVTAKQALEVQERWIEYLGVVNVELISLPAGKYVIVSCEGAFILSEVLAHINRGGYYLTYVISHEPRDADSQLFRNAYCAACKMASTAEQEQAWGAGYCYVRFKGEPSVAYSRGAHLLADVRQVLQTAAGFHITESDLQSVP